MTITEFLTARLDELETAARTASSYDDDDSPWPSYMVVQEPEFVLAEVAAKRALIADLATFDKVATSKAGSDLSTRLTARGVERGTMHALRTLAQPYADHPDYREEWRP